MISLRISTSYSNTTSLSLVGAGSLRAKDLDLIRISGFSYFYLSVFCCEDWLSLERSGRALVMLAPKILSFLRSGARLRGRRVSREQLSR